MSFFNPHEPLVRCKQEALDVQDLRGLLRIEYRLGKIQLFSGVYTRIDQTFLVWGWITAVIFAVAQFSPVNWRDQAILWSLLTGVGVVIMASLAWFWVQVEQLRWVVYTWTLLMLMGVLLTDGGIFLGWGWVVLNLCQIWLGLSALGYLLTGWGLRSRTFCLASAIHGAGVLLLPYFSTFPYLFSGMIIAGTLLFLSEVQWDMRPPSAPALLTVEETEFNRLQQQRRSGLDR
ncbi:hypothetical protein [Lyngbya confervoides]|uniref:DUF2157 domain-containing protein n=1 Tax=Lyngbya confervoides BDU141951 TaxID=1574623 RepID=A0ABD4SY77_9CYAN|nr:hypothetical protein [Lyngbya confervoides]MCM1981452.1 hypothetical protein [Lyngbya confervoides BDU141951]